jgi:hypothetical protein
MAPVKTAAGLAELAHRTHGLSQRHRTVLLLVDGRRPAALVQRLAVQAGAAQSCFDELVALGLVSIEGPSLPAVDSSLLPPARTLAPDSAWHTDRGLPATAVDGPLEEARGILLRAVRNEAPVTGSLTMLKLKRAAGRDELEALLEEVEQRIRKPRRTIIAAQTLRHVRHLLSLPAREAAKG